MYLMHIYHGEGKGKTTAAIGLAIRAIGHGMKVYFVQFMKGRESGELKIFEQLENIEVRRCDRDYGFYHSMSDKAKEDITECHNRMLTELLQLPEDEVDLIILDEINGAHFRGLLDEELANAVIEKYYHKKELVLTGRNPQMKYLQMADYVSRMVPEKHPYESGISAREGIEY